MRQGKVKYNNKLAGLLTDDDNGEYLFVYAENYVQTYTNQFINFKCLYPQSITQAKDFFWFSMD